MRPGVNITFEKRTRNNINGVVKLTLLIPPVKLQIITIMIIKRDTVKKCDFRVLYTVGRPQSRY